MPKSLPSLPSLRLALTAIFALVLLAGGLSLADGNEATTSLKRVETKKVCMVNNQVFEKDQIPVNVQGKTYYGCCEMCKERLAQNAEARTAVDPVTGKKVDKATAVIAALPDGSVLYFENEKTLEQYGKKK